MMRLLPWLTILAALFFALWVRFSLIEQAEFGFFCDGGGQSGLCHLRWFILQSFLHYGLGYFGLFFGLLALASRSALVAMLAGVAGVAGLVLYTWDFSAVAFLLGILTLARAQFDDSRHQYSTSEQQA